MHTAISKSAKPAATVPADFVPLDQETRTHVSTAVLCRHINRKEGTVHGWVSAGAYPAGLEPPVRVKGRHAWPVAGIRTLLGLVK